MLVPGIEKGLLKYKSKINKARERSIIGNIIILYFACSQFEQSLEWLNKILQDKKAEHRQDIQRFVRIMQLILHYELGNDRVLEHLYRSTYRLLRRKEDLHLFESIVLNFIRKLMEASSESEKQAYFRAFQEELHQPTLTNHKPIGFEEISIWIEAKLKKTSFINIMKSRTASAPS